MSRDEMVFSTGMLIGVVVQSLVMVWEQPWWFSLLLFPLAVWWIASLGMAWHRRWREWAREGR